MTELYLEIGAIDRAKHLSVVKHSSIVCESDNKTESHCTKEKDGNGKRSPGNARDEWLC